MPNNEDIADNNPELSAAAWDGPDPTWGQIPRRVSPARGSFWRTLRYYAPTIIIVGVVLGVGCGSPILDALMGAIRSTHTETVTSSVCGTWEVTMNPLGLESHGKRLDDIVAISNDDVWIVGKSIAGETSGRPLYVHWDGKDFRSVPALQVQYDSFRDKQVATISKNDEWKIRQVKYQDTVISHWDGTSWSEVPGLHIPDTYQDEDKLSAISAAPNGDVWVVGRAEKQDFEDSPFHVPFVAHFVRCSNSGK